MSNTSPIRIIATWKIKPGQTEAFVSLAKALTEDMRKNEPGCEALSWCLAADGRTFHIFEQYTDSAAILAHMANPQVQAVIPKFLALAEGPSPQIYGDTSPEVTQMLAPFGTAFSRPQFGFTR